MPEQLPRKNYYSIGEVAKAFGVNPSHIRFWEKSFDELKPKKNSKGDRRFTPSDVETLKLIFFLTREKGYTLDGAKKYLQHHKKRPSVHLIIERLQQVRADLIKLKESL